VNADVTQKLEYYHQTFESNAIFEEQIYIQKLLEITSNYNKIHVKDLVNYLGCFEIILENNEIRPAALIRVDESIYMMTRLEISDEINAILHRFEAIIHRKYQSMLVAAKPKFNVAVKAVRNKNRILNAMVKYIESNESLFGKNSELAGVDNNELLRCVQELGSDRFRCGAVQRLFAGNRVRGRGRVAASSQLSWPGKKPARLGV